MSSKKKNNWAILANFSPYRYEVNERSHFPTKNPKINPFVVKSLMESNCKRFRKSAIRENFNLKPETQLKKSSFQQRRQLYPSIHWSKREAVTSFLHLRLNHNSAPGRWHVCISKSFFYSSPTRNTFQARAGPPTSRCINRLHNIFQSTIITVYEVEHQMTVNTKLGKQTIWFSEVIKDFHHYFQEKEAERHKKIERKVALHS